MININNNIFSDFLVVKSNPNSYISEAYRTLRANIEFAMLDKKFSTIMITSPVPQEDIDISTANLATVIAESRKKVIVVDCNLRRPQIHRIFKRNAKPGITNVLIVDIGLSEVIQKVNEINSNLYFISAGPVPPNPSELIGSERMKSVIKELKKQADIVIFFSPPVIGFADSLELANQVDGAILFINAGSVNQEAAKQAKNLLERTKVEILGVVLNNVSIKKEGYYWQYNYQKYYRNT